MKEELFEQLIESIKQGGELIGWGVYIIETHSGTLYTGATNRLWKRWETHQNGSGAKYLRAHKPKRVVYWEGTESKSEALKREATIKRMSRAQKLKLIREGVRITLQEDSHERKS